MTSKGRSSELFLRSVGTGPLQGSEVAAQWGTQTLGMVYQWAQKTTSEWTEDLARTAYRWFSSKTERATRLFWWNKLMIPALRKVGGGIGEDLPRLILPRQTRDDAAERYVHRSGRVPAHTYYYRQVRDGNYLGHGQ